MTITKDTTIEKTLILPYREDLTIEGCTIKIAKGAHIICTGRFMAENVHFEPIEDVFGAIVILGNNSSVIFRCTFYKGGGIKQRVLKDYPIFWELFPREGWKYIKKEYKPLLKAKIAGGLICENTEVIECDFNECSSSKEGGSIFAIRSFIDKTKFRSSHTKGKGGAIGGRENYVQECSFVDCFAKDSGGAISGNNKVFYCSFMRCSANESGGAIFGNDQTISSSTFLKCHSKSGGAIEGAMNVYECVFENCSAEDSGGAICTSSNTSVVTKSKFINCKVKKEDALMSDAIYAFPETILLNCVFENSLESTKSFIHGYEVKVIKSTFISLDSLIHPISIDSNFDIIKCLHNGVKIKCKPWVKK